MDRRCLLAARVDRRRLLAATGGAVCGTTGCLGSAGPSVRFVNETDGERELSVRVRRPADVTPSAGTDGLVVLDRATVTLSAGETRTRSDVFPDDGRVLVRADLAADNGEGTFGDETSTLRRGDAAELDPPLDVTVWYVEDSPQIDDSVASLAEPETLFDVVIDPIGST